jgi:3-hydroxybutyrate dehydrogenase
MKRMARLELHAAAIERLSMKLTTKRALVTGSTSGIGSGIAEVLASAGCDIVLNGFGEPDIIMKLIQRLETRYGVVVRHIEADVSNRDDCRSLVAQALSKLGNIDILVNNAGIQHVAPVEAFPPDRWDAIISTNLSSAFYLTAAILPEMRDKGWGRIINISSVHGLVGSKFKSAYVAAKHGLIGFTKVVALETAGSGITCNAICPGWALTPMVDAQIQERMREEKLERREAEHYLLKEKQPSGAFATPQQIGSLVAFLCSESADNITGASLPIDGAWTAQ